MDFQNDNIEKDLERYKTELEYCEIVNEYCSHPITKPHRFLKGIYEWFISNHFNYYSENNFVELEYPGHSEKIKISAGFDEYDIIKYGLRIDIKIPFIYIHLIFSVYRKKNQPFPKNFEDLKKNRNKIPDVSSSVCFMKNFKNNSYLSEECFEPLYFILKQTRNHGF